MALEARVLAEGTQNARIVQVTVAAGTAIPKGTLLVWTSGDRTAIAHSAASGGANMCGFATEEKTATDGKTTIGVQCAGIVDAYLDGSVSSGDLIEAGHVANTVRSINACVAGTSVMNLKRVAGFALEQGTNAQQIKVCLTKG